MKNIQKGLVGLLQSRKGTLSLVILACITTLCFLGRMDGTSFAACCTVIGSVFCFTQSQTDRQSMRMVESGQSMNGIGDMVQAGVSKIITAINPPTPESPPDNEQQDQ